MKNLTLTLTTGIAALALLAPGALAGDDKHCTSHDWFKKAAGEDNVMTLAEFTAAKGEKMDADKLQAKFAKMDADGDGKITEDECKEGCKAAKHDGKDDDKSDQAEAAE